MVRHNPTSFRGGLHARWQRFNDTLLNTLRDLEGDTLDQNPSMLLHEPPTGRLIVDFSQWGRTPDINTESDTTRYGYSGTPTKTHASENSDDHARSVETRSQRLESEQGYNPLQN